MQYKNIDIRWLGHAGFVIHGSKIIYIDPYNLSDESDLDKADIILITHGHYDHCSIEDIRKVMKKDSVIVCPADVQSKLRHVSEEVNARLIEPDMKIEFPETGIVVWGVRAYNLTKSAHTKEEDWMGYILLADDVYIYHAGDTDIIPEMKKLSDIDIALLPVGGTFTMNAGEAAKAAALIRPKLAVPMHYGSIIGERKDAEIFIKQCNVEGVEAKILEKEIS